MATQTFKVYSAGYADLDTIPARLQADLVAAIGTVKHIGTVDIPNGLALWVVYEYEERLR